MVDLYIPIEVYDKAIFINQYNLSEVKWIVCMKVSSHATVLSLYYDFGDVAGLAAFVHPTCFMQMNCYSVRTVTSLES